MGKKIRLKGHEKFPLREGWLNKGLFGIREHEKVFSASNATDILGVGSNMVKSIRYWMLAFGLIEDTQKLTEIGKVISDYDEYFEDIFTLWILHSSIAKNAERATLWYLFFNECRIMEFTKEDVIANLNRILIAYAGRDDFSRNSIKDDVDVLLNMYSKENILDDPEDKNRCPFVTLGLIKKSDNLYSKNQPDLRKFDSRIILYEIYADIGERDSVSIDEVAETAGSVYHLTRMSVNSLLDELDNSGYIRVNRTAGLDMIYPLKTMTKEDVLKDYYQNR